MFDETKGKESIEVIPKKATNMMYVWKNPLNTVIFIL